MNKFFEETTAFVKKGCSQAGELTSQACDAAPGALKKCLDGAKKNKEAVVLAAAAAATVLTVNKLLKRSKKNK